MQNFLVSIIYYIKISIKHTIKLKVHDLRKMNKIKIKNKNKIQTHPYTHITHHSLIIIIALVKKLKEEYYKLIK